MSALFLVEGFSSPELLGVIPDYMCLNFCFWIGITTNLSWQYDINQKLLRIKSLKNKGLSGVYPLAYAKRGIWYIWNILIDVVGVFAGGVHHYHEIEPIKKIQIQNFSRLVCAHVHTIEKPYLQSKYWKHHPWCTELRFKRIPHPVLDYSSVLILRYKNRNKS